MEQQIAGTVGTKKERNLGIELLRPRRYEECRRKLDQLRHQLAADGALLWLRKSPLRISDLCGWLTEKVSFPVLYVRKGKREYIDIEALAFPALLTLQRGKNF